MNPNNNQQQMTPEEAKASLGLSSRIVEQMLQQKHPKQQETPAVDNTNQVNQQTQPQIDVEAIKSELLKEMKPEIDSTIKSQMDEIRGEINKALENEQN